MKNSYELTIREIGKESAEVIIISADEYQNLMECFERQDWFVVDIEGVETFFNIPFLSSIKIKKID